MKQLLIILTFIILISTSCLRLDELLFNNSVIDEYLLDDYPFEVDMVLGDEYRIDDNMIHLFPLQSKMSSETESVKIWALYVGDINTIDTDTVILYCHGNRDHMDFYWPRVKLLANAGSKNRFGIMTFDYRGFGKSEGTPTEEGMYADTEAALLWLASQGLTSDRLIMYGFSLGSAPATKYSAKTSYLKPSKLILENPFASSEVMIQDGTALTLPGSYFVNLQISNAEYIKQVEQPFLWLHGKEDDFLSIETHGEVIFKNYSGVEGFPYRIPNAGHGSLPQTMGFELYNNTVYNFITDKLPQPKL